MKAFLLLLTLAGAGTVGCANQNSAGGGQEASWTQGRYAAADGTGLRPVSREAAPSPAHLGPTESLLANSLYWISNRVRGKDGWDTNRTRATFSSMKWTTGSTNRLLRNTNAWLHGVKGLTALAPCNLHVLYHSPGTAVTPRHIIMAKHNATGPGNVFEFVTHDNQVHARKMIAVSSPTNVSDLTIGLLDADLPPGIGFLRVMPPSWRELMPTAFTNSSSQVYARRHQREESYPVIGFNHWKQGFVADLAGYGVFLDKSEWFPNWFGRGAGGDSGHPLCVLAQDELFLYSHYTSPQGGPKYPDCIAEVNAAMEELSRKHKAPVYRLTVAEELERFLPKPAQP